MRNNNDGQVKSDVVDNECDSAKTNMSSRDVEDRVEKDGSTSNGYLLWLSISHGSLSRIGSRWLAVAVSAAAFTFDHHWSSILLYSFNHEINIPLVDESTFLSIKKYLLQLSNVAMRMSSAF